MRGAIVLAGGKGKRFGGIDKSTLKINDKEMILYVLDSLEKVCDEIVISVRNKDQKKLLSHLPYTFALDTVKNYGPLSGFYSGSRVLKSKYAFVVGCDMPFLNPKAIKFLFREAEGFSCAIPRHLDGKKEPLHSVYNVKEVYKASKKVLLEKKRVIFDMIDLLENVKFVDCENLRIFDPELLTFKNINSWEELEFVRKVFKGKFNR